MSETPKVKGDEELAARFAEEFPPKFLFNITRDQFIAYAAHWGHTVSLNPSTKDDPTAH